MQRAFVMELMVDQNATQAAIRAGASPKTATAVSSKWLRLAHVAAAVAEQRSIRARGAMVSAEWVRENLKSTMTRALELDPPDLKTVVKCLELLGRDAGMWPAKPVEINANIHVNVQQAVANLSRMTPDELRALARAKAPLLALPPPSDEM